MGIRIALGASAINIQALILRHALLVTALGLGSGLLGSEILGRVLGHLVLSVTITDPFSFGTALGELLAMSVAATALPTWRASRTDPVITLRAE